jgi:hypothetical protein
MKVRDAKYRVSTLNNDSFMLIWPKFSVNINGDRLDEETWTRMLK